MYDSDFDSDTTSLRLHHDSGECRRLVFYSLLTADDTHTMMRYLLRDGTDRRNDDGMARRKKWRGEFVIIMEHWAFGFVVVCGFVSGLYHRVPSEQHLDRDGVDTATRYTFSILYVEALTLGSPMIHGLEIGIRCNQQDPEEWHSMANLEHSAEAQVTEGKMGAIGGGLTLAAGGSWSKNRAPLPPWAGLRVNSKCFAPPSFSSAIFFFLTSSTLWMSRPHSSSPSGNSRFFTPLTTSNLSLDLPVKYISTEVG